MHRASLIASLIAFATFIYAQARGIDPLNYYDSSRPVQSSAKSGSYHK